MKMINTKTYSECCSKLEKIASKRKIYGSDSTLNLTKKHSTLSVPSHGSVRKNEKRQLIKLPFVGGGSANKSHNIGITIQATSAIIKQFPEYRYAEDEYTTNFSRLSIFPELSDMQLCPARSSEELTIEEEKNFDDSSVSPWSVKQTDPFTIIDSECGHQNKTCSCPSRFGDSYKKVMASFTNDSKCVDNEPEMAPNPYTKAKNVIHYESLSRSMKQLQLTISSMNNKCLKLTEKYTKLYQQHVRNENSNLTSVLFAIEDEIKALKAKVDEACDVYKEASLVIVQERPTDAMETKRKADNSFRRDTTSVRLAKVFHRIQTLQDKCKTGHFVHGQMP